MTGPAADADPHALLRRQTGGLHEVIGLRLVTGNKKDLIHAPERPAG